MKYIKKPISIEARQWTGDNTAELIAWADGNVMKHPYLDALIIQTPEGKMSLRRDNYLIKGPVGEFYPVEKSIFEATYIDAEKIGELSDGHHTFDELYEHRHLLFLAFLEALTDQPFDVFQPWMSERHHGGGQFVGWFIAGVKINDKQITYHLPMRLWDLAEKIGSAPGQTGIAILDSAPEWDGHTAADVLKRLENFIAAK